MSKQINFYATEDDKVLISNILIRVFGELIEVPLYTKNNISSFDPQIEKEVLYLAEKNRENEIIYRIHEYYDGSKSEVLDRTKSPVLEYSLPLKNMEGYFINGRFYCCSDNAEFSKKVSVFFAKLKKEFWYIKKWKIYISKSIDVNNALFFVPNRVVKISKDELV